MFKTLALLSIFAISSFASANSADTAPLVKDCTGYNRETSNQSFRLITNGTELLVKNSIGFNVKGLDRTNYKKARQFQDGANRTMVVFEAADKSSSYTVAIWNLILTGQKEEGLVLVNNKSTLATTVFYCVLPAQ